jgi:hypothetical protein
VQTINWGQLVAGVLPDPCRGGTLHGFAVNLIRVGTRSGHALETFLVIKKKKKKKNKKEKKKKNSERMVYSLVIAHVEEIYYLRAGQSY